MPVCRKCKENKPDEAFAWRWRTLGVRQKVCRECRSAENAQWYETHRDEQIARSRKNTDRNREKARKWVYNYLKKHTCEMCGESDPACLDFHHTGEFEKFKPVSEMIAEGYSVQSIAQEISKCEVLCANCHRKKTAKQQNWYDW